MYWLKVNRAQNCHLTEGNSSRLHQEHTAYQRRTSVGICEILNNRYENSGKRLLRRSIVVPIICHGGPVQMPSPALKAVFCHVFLTLFRAKGPGDTGKVRVAHPGRHFEPCHGEEVHRVKSLRNGLLVLLIVSDRRFAGLIGKRLRGRIFSRQKWRDFDGTQLKLIKNKEINFKSAWKMIKTIRNIYR